MLHGKRGFDRLVYACKNISSTSLNWICISEDSCKALILFISKGADPLTRPKPKSIQSLTGFPIPELT